MVVVLVFFVTRQVVVVLYVVALLFLFLVLVVEVILVVVVVVLIAVDDALVAITQAVGERFHPRRRGCGQRLAPGTADLVAQTVSDLAELRRLAQLSKPLHRELTR